MCRAKDIDGNQCICMRCPETELIDNKVLCKSCGHIETAHPESKPSLGGLIRGFRDAGKLGTASSSATTIKATKEEAAAETSAGLKKKRKSDTDTEPPPPSKKNKAIKGNDTDVKFKYGKLVLITGGIQDGALVQSALPRPEVAEDMRAAGLIVLSTPNKPLVLSPSWNNGRLNREIERVVPKAIRWLKAQPYQGDPTDDPEIKKQLWLAVIKHRTSITLARDPLPTGVELVHHCKTKGTSGADRVLYIASKIKIPSKRYMDWDASDSEPESEELGSDIETIDSEDISMSPRRHAPKKSKGKSKQDDTVRVKHEKEETETDMRKAAKMRTRLSTGTIKYKPLFIPESSDGPEAEPIGGSSKSTDEDIVVISDDEGFPPPAPTLVPTPPLSLIASAWKSPLHIRHPTLSPEPEPRSPDNTDPPTFFDDFDFSPPNYTGMINSNAPVASSSSSATASSSSLSASTSTSSLTLPNIMPSPLATVVADPGGELWSTTVSGAVAPLMGGPTPRRRFKKMGSGRDGRDPWV
ncbi:hypothetical protein B0H15DRAFT_800955 [Mycena belliarum]|uniref:Uncharacterized protein n=1 Tax=Mycena belliarum TaxID=1033014 RepID=A0AAD6XRZ2_9AGAR|nr:hypothetical protein B0H15DRAFT_800955 [Mycena belliae]